jgi:hypothetical protein
MINKLLIPELSSDESPRLWFVAIVEQQGHKVDEVSIADV